MFPSDKFEQQDAEHLRYGDSEFDTVVDTLGLCSCEDPRAVLKEMQRVCKVRRPSPFAIGNKSLDCSSTKA